MSKKKLTKEQRAEYETIINQWVPEIGKRFGEFNYADCERMVRICEARARHHERMVDLLGRLLEQRRPQS